MVAMTTVGSDYKERVFRSSAVTPVGITIVVCAVIIRELLAHDQTISFSFFPWSCTLCNTLLCDGGAVGLMCQCVGFGTNVTLLSSLFQGICG